MEECYKTAYGARVSSRRNLKHRAFNELRKNADNIKAVESSLILD